MTHATAHRADVTRLLKLSGWTQHENGSLSRGGVVFSAVGRRRDSVLKLFEHPDFTIEFSPEIPAVVVAAACKAAAEHYGVRSVAA